MGPDAEQAALRLEAQRVTIIPSIWAANAAPNATLRGNVSLARIASAIGADTLELDPRSV
jgi:hypothetical protein